jgi:hypothetical protein
MGLTAASGQPTWAVVFSARRPSEIHSQQRSTAHDQGEQEAAEGDFADEGQGKEVTQATKEREDEMTKTYEKGVGGSDATKLPVGKPTGITSATEFNDSALENAVDVTQDMGPTAPRVQRGTFPPATGPGRDYTSKG